MYTDIIIFCHIPFVVMPDEVYIIVFCIWMDKMSPKK